jgi:cell division protease FtsH
MSDTPEEPKKKPEKGPQRERGSHTNFLWYALVFSLVGMVVFSTMNSHSGELMEYSEFVRKIESGTLSREEVQELQIGPMEMTWQSRSAEYLKNNRAADVERYRVGLWGQGDDAAANLEQLLYKHDIKSSYKTAPSPWNEILPTLLLIGLLVAFMVFMVRRLGGAGSAMSFGRSRGKLFAQEDISITFDDVAGIDEPLEELKEIVEFLKTPQKYQSLGGRIPRGVLLVGPPGTGKTLLAKAVAGEAGVPFFSLSGSDFVEMYVGVGAARVRDMFQQALQRSPSIIFIDELDALGKVRGSGGPGGHDEREQTLNALLVEMDGFGTDHSVIVMGATNRPETLDPALRRPGRFDRHVVVDRPDIKGRAAILDVHAKKVKLSDDVKLKKIAKLTPGFVGADLANLVNEAALLSVRRGDTRVTMQSFEEGVERVMAGLEKTSRIVLEEVKRRVASHESGHALVAASLPNTDPVHKISIIPRGLGALGYMLQVPEDERELLTQSELDSRIAVLLGGIAAEQIVYDETSTGAQNDLQRASDMARRMVTEFGMSPRLGRMFYSESQRSPFLGAGGPGIIQESIHSEETLREIDLEVKRIVDESYRRAYEILKSQQDVLEHLSQDLFEKETMTADEMHRIIAEHRDGPKIAPGTTALPARADEDPAPERGEAEVTREAAD